jgi:hypothetical protein
MPLLLWVDGLLTSVAHVASISGCAFQFRGRCHLPQVDVEFSHFGYGEDNIKITGEINCESDSDCSGSCPVAGFVISCVEPSGSATK